MYSIWKLLRALQEVRRDDASLAQLDCEGSLWRTVSVLKLKPLPHYFLFEMLRKCGLPIYLYLHMEYAFHAKAAFFF